MNIEQPVRLRNTSWQLDMPLSRFFTLNRAVVLLGGILLLVVISRFWDLGGRALHHDESLHAVYSFYLYDNGGYRHQPLMHGPALFHLTALGYWFFGASDAMSRLVPALLGLFVAWAPWKFRNWLGTKGALAASAFILISPSLLYYSRFIRHDIFFAAWTLIIVYGMWKYMEGGQAFHLYLMSAGWGLAFSQKELSFLMAFIFWTFLAVVFGLRVIGRLGAKVNPRQSREGHLLVLMGALFLPFITATLLFAVGYHPGDVGNHSETSVYNFASNWPIEFNVVAYGVVIGLFLIGLAAAKVLWDWRKFAIAAAVFWSIFILLHTTFLTNPFGLGSGVIGALGYWIEQQEVARGEQPWYYYMLLFPLYEFFPLLIAFIGGPILLWRGRHGRVAPLLPPSEKEGRADELVGATQVEVQEGQEAEEQALLSEDWASEHPGASQQQEQHLNAQALWPYFNFWWMIVVFVLLSIAGEKMPWLLVHLALPIALLAGWAMGLFFSGVKWEVVTSQSALAFGALFFLALFAFFSLCWMFVSDQWPFRGTDEANLKATIRWLVTMLMLAGTGWSAASLSERLGAGVTRQMVVLTLSVLLTLVTVRYAIIASYINSDNAHEPMIFVQSSPSVTMVVKDLEAISVRLGGQEKLKVAYDNFNSWPFDWYLRKYPGRIFYGEEPSDHTDQLKEAHVILVGWKNEEKLKPLVAGYVRHQYSLRWWFPEDYKDLILRYEEVADPDNPNQMIMQQVGSDTDKSPFNVVRNIWLFAKQPGYLSDFWTFIWDRKVKEPLGGENFIVYTRPDIAAELWQHGNQQIATSPEPSEEILPPSSNPDSPSADYSQISVPLAASVMIGQPGEFSSPKNVGVLPDGNLAVLDSGNHRIRIMDLEGNLVREFGSLGEDPGQFSDPWGMAVAPDGTIYVADTWNHRVQHLDQEGNLLHVWGTFADTAGQLEQPGTFWGPRDLAVDEAGNVYVTDTGNKRVQKFDAQGNFLLQFGGAGNGPGQLSEPVGVTVAPDGTIYVADTWNLRIQSFSPEGEALQQIPVGAWVGQNLLNKPFLAASNDRIWISDPEGYRLIEMNTQGEPQRVWGQYGNDANGLNLPLGVTFDGTRLWVADSENGRILGYDVE
ncbi:MAG: flippase activity-associated protein Agl23 [Ardenticatenaceae bacterium]